MKYDGSYHKLFSNPEMIEDLVRHFVHEDWVDALDFKSRERINTKFHSEKLQRRESDIIFRILTEAGESTYLYLLLEFQSSQDHWMPLRINTYVSLFYEHLIKDKQLTNKGMLPSVFPIVLYNGEQRWSRATKLSQLIDLPKKSSLWAYQPQLRYYMIDESLYPQGLPGSLSGTLFKLENTKDTQQLLVYLDELVQLLKAMASSKQLNRDFFTWITHVLEPVKQLELNLNQIEDLVEVRNMLRDRVKEWEKQIFEEAHLSGIERGIEKGVEQGVIQGEAQLLICQIEARFNKLDASQISRIKSASASELEAWSLRILDAESVDEVFE